MKCIISLMLLLTTACFAQDKVHTFARAIAKAEGFERKGTLPNRYRNPGDLKAVTGYKYPGQIGVSKRGYVVFRTNAAGWSALEHQIEKIINGESRYTVNMTLKEISKKYSGGSRVWAKNVARNLGVTPDVYLWEILDVAPVLEGQWQ